MDDKETNTSGLTKIVLSLLPYDGTIIIMFKSGDIEKIPVGLFPEEMQERFWEMILDVSQESWETYEKFGEVAES